MQDAGYKMQVSGCRIQVAGYRIQVTAFTCVAINPASCNLYPETCISALNG